MEIVKVIQCATNSAQETLKQSAIIRKNEVAMRKLSGEDLIANDAHYHEECRKE